MNPATEPSRARIAELRLQLGRMATPLMSKGVLPFGVTDIDDSLPSGGLARGALHEVFESGPRSYYAASATLFAAGILARLQGPVLWCLHSRDLFAPALARVGLHPDRVIYCETWKDSEVLPAMEEGLRHAGLAAVLGELNHLTLTPSRRLQLAAEKSGVMALALRRSGDPNPEINAAHSRWSISGVRSDPNDIFGMGRARWVVELLRCRGAEPNAWILEACDAQGHLALPADVVDRPRSREGRWRASA